MNTDDRTRAERANYAQEQKAMKAQSSTTTLPAQLDQLIERWRSRRVAPPCQCVFTECADDLAALMDVALFDELAALREAAALTPEPENASEQFVVRAEMLPTHRGKAVIVVNADALLQAVRDALSISTIERVTVEKLIKAAEAPVLPPVTTKDD